MCTIGCANTSTSTASRLAFYSFDGNANDIHGVYSATASGSPTYVTGYVTSAISFDAPSTQRLSAPSMSFNSRSFTIEFWFYSSVLIGYNYALFGQLSSINTAKQTLFVVLNNGRMGLGFYNDDTYSNRVFSASTWYHVALVYDNNVRQRFIYIDGVLDAQSAFNVGPYLGTSGTVTIGGADIYGGYGILYSTAVMDLLSVSTRAKSTCEIYNDATLAAYLPFDGSVVDGGPNVVPVTSSAVSFTTGVINQGVSFSGSSYVQIGSLTGLGRTNYPFSIAFWVYPIVYGSLVHVSTGSNGKISYRNQFYSLFSSIFFFSRSWMVCTFHRFQWYWPDNRTSIQFFSIYYPRTSHSNECLDTYHSNIQSDQWTSIIRQWSNHRFHQQWNILCCQ